MTARPQAKCKPGLPPCAASDVRPRDKEQCQ
jgi:hypothetical protein